MDQNCDNCDDDRFKTLVEVNPEKYSNHIEQFGVITIIVSIPGIERLRTKSLTGYLLFADHKKKGLFLIDHVNQ